MSKQTMSNDELREVLHESNARVTYVGATLDLLRGELADCDDPRDAQKASGTLLLLQEELDRIGNRLDEAWLRSSQQGRTTEEATA